MNMAETIGGIVYVLTNPAMPDLTKIGQTTQEDITFRMSQLYSTGVPVPFECIYACRVNDSGAVESALHMAFGNSRVNPKREFFKIEPERVIAVLKLLAVEDVTPSVEKEISGSLDDSDKESLADLKKSRRPKMNFKEMNIPVGAVLTYVDDGQIQIKVVDDRHVEHDGVEQLTQPLTVLPVRRGRDSEKQQPIRIRLQQSEVVVDSLERVCHTNVRFILDHRVELERIKPLDAVRALPAQRGDRRND